VSQREKIEHQAKQNKSHAVAGIEAYPTPPHGGFFRDDRGNLAHADLQGWVTGREIRSPERIDEVGRSEHKNDARTKNHENSCRHGALQSLPVSVPTNVAPWDLNWRNTAISLNMGLALGT